MIAYLKGKIIFKGEKFVILDVNNVGYKVFISSKTLQDLEEGQELELFTSCLLKRETFEIYGFLSQEEMRLFELLNNIPGIGPKASLSITSLGTLDELKKAIEENNQNFFSGIKGVGKKKIQKIILEIGGQIKSFGLTKTSSYSDENKKLFDTLLRLGFPRQEIRKTLEEIPDDIKDFSAKVKFALSKLSKH